MRGDADIAQCVGVLCGELGKLDIKPSRSPGLVSSSSGSCLRSRGSPHPLRLSFVSHRPGTHFAKLFDMPSFAVITAALALASSVAATPIEKRDAFSVEQVARGTYRKNGMLQSYQSFCEINTENTPRCCTSSQDFPQIWQGCSRKHPRCRREQ